MPNPEHLAILKEGVERWNVWRRENPDIQPDLSGVDFSEKQKKDDLDPGFAHLFERKEEWKTSGRLQVGFHSPYKIQLPGINLSNANLANSNLQGARLDKANLSSADMTRAILAKVDLRQAQLRKARLFYTQVGYHNIIFPDVPELHQSDLSGADLGQAILDGADFASVSLIEAKLVKARLLDVNFHSADLMRADLSGADLRYTNLTNANLQGAYFTEATVFGAIFANTNLADAKELDSCLHTIPSTLDHRTLARSGDIPIEFLRGCGLPETYIDYLPSLLGKPFEFYSCFISYSSKNDDFARRLHADLQDNGVRCWFAPEDLKIGDKIRGTIHDAIRLHDKLLLILSEDSVHSQWVEDEVERALDRESSEGGTILFPIRLDDSVLESDSGWASTVKRTRHIGDFRSWKDHDAYQTAFERLLRDLKAGV